MPMEHECEVGTQYLRHFVSVAEAASVSKAALRVHISQPALSRQITISSARARNVCLSALVAESGCRPRASPAYKYASADGLGPWCRARALAGGTTGVLRGGDAAGDAEHLPGFLAEYRRSRPGIEIEVDRRRWRAPLEPG